MCASDLVSLPHKDLPCSDGSIDPLTPDSFRNARLFIILSVRNFGGFVRNFG